MTINKYGVEYILELQNSTESEGILCCERIIVRVHDDGGGAYLSLRTDNLEPDEEFDNHTVTIGRADIPELAAALESILEDAG